MTTIFRDGALHPGRDANDSWWRVVRRAEDWDGASFTGTAFDPSRAVVELAAAALAAAEEEDAFGQVTAPDGTRYTSDALHARVLRQRACDAAPSPLPGVGGAGWSSGRFRDPAGLALDDRGWLYVADRGNHRVQVIDPRDRPEERPSEARVIIVLGAVDAWGRPAAGETGGAMHAPSAVAVGPTRIYVADRGGRVHVFDRGFRFALGFVAATPGNGPADIVAIAVDADDLLVVADAGRSRLLRFDCRGRFVDERGYAGAPEAVAVVEGRARFAITGTVVVGPIDGGLDQLAWHQVGVDAQLPAGTSIEVQTFARDGEPADPTAPAPGAPPLPAVVPWAPRAPVALPLAAIETAEGEHLRPVLSDTATWERWTNAPYRRGAPLLFRFTGDGPSGIAAMTVPAEVARRLRAGDDLELRSTGAAPDAVRVLAIPDRTVTLTASGARVDVAAGATVWLLARGGRERDPVTIHTLAGSETLPLSAVTADGGVAEVAFPHAIAALLERGDRLEISGPTPTVVSVDELDAAPVTLALVGAPAGDRRVSALHLVAASDRIVVEHSTGWGDGFPAGDAVIVEWLDAGGALQRTAATVRWSDPAVATAWIDLPLPSDWISLLPAAAPVSTDRGRYLWVKLRLYGARGHGSDPTATATPTVRALRLVAPRLSYLSYLPGVFSRRDDDDATGAVFLERFLAVFERRLTGIEASYEAVARLLNPLAADDAWLDFVAGWFDVVFDPSWPRARRARMLTEIFELYRRRGTPWSIVRFIELYTGHRPELIEAFQVRPRAGLMLGSAAPLGCAPLGAQDVAGDHAHRFTLVAHVDHTCDLDVARPAIRALVDAVKPAHTVVDLRVVVPHGRIGLESTIGLDFVLAAGGSTPAKDFTIR